MVKSDFKFITDLVTKFFNQAHIIRRMNLIHSNDITGWEIWLQVEFAMFIEDQIEVDQWLR